MDEVAMTTAEFMSLAPGDKVAFRSKPTAPLGMPWTVISEDDYRRERRRPAATKHTVYLREESRPEEPLGKRPHCWATVDEAEEWTKL